MATESVGTEFQNEIRDFLTSIGFTDVPEDSDVLMRAPKLRPNAEDFIHTSEIRSLLDEKY